MSGATDEGRRIAGAAALAVERVNADKSLLPGRRLEYSAADSGCSAQQGLAAMGELLGGASRVDAVIGPGCTVASAVTSYLAAGQGLPQISWGSTAPSLSSKAEFPLVSLAHLVTCTLCNCLSIAVLTYSGARAEQRAGTDRFHGKLSMEKRDFIVKHLCRCL